MMTLKTLRSDRDALNLKVETAQRSINEHLDLIEAAEGRGESAADLWASVRILQAAVRPHAQRLNALNDEIARREHANRVARLAA